MSKFLNNRLRDQDFAEERWKDFRTVNDDQVFNGVVSATTTPGAFMLQ
jgi:hypothetical protein